MLIAGALGLPVPWIVVLGLSVLAALALLAVYTLLRDHDRLTDEAQFNLAIKGLVLDLGSGFQLGVRFDNTGSKAIRYHVDDMRVTLAGADLPPSWGNRGGIIYPGGYSEFSYANAPFDKSQLPIGGEIEYTARYGLAAGTLSFRSTRKMLFDVLRSGEEARLRVRHLDEREERLNQRGKWVSLIPDPGTPAGPS